MNFAFIVKPGKKIFEKIVLLHKIESILITIKEAHNIISKKLLDLTLGKIVLTLINKNSNKEIKESIKYLTSSPTFNIEEKFNDEITYNVNHRYIKYLYQFLGTVIIKFIGKKNIKYLFNKNSQDHKFVKNFYQLIGKKILQYINQNDIEYLLEPSESIESRDNKIKYFYQVIRWFINYLVFNISLTLICLMICTLPFPPLIILISSLISCGFYGAIIQGNDDCVMQQDIFRYNRISSYLTGAINAIICCVPVCAILIILPASLAYPLLIPAIFITTTISQKTMCSIESAIFNLLQYLTFVLKANKLELYINYNINKKIFNNIHQEVTQAINSFDFKKVLQDSKIKDMNENDKKKFINEQIKNEIRKILRNYSNYHAQLYNSYYSSKKSEDENLENYSELKIPTFEDAYEQYLNFKFVDKIDSKKVNPSSANFESKEMLCLFLDYNTQTFNGLIYRPVFTQIGFVDFRYDNMPYKGLSYIDKFLFGDRLRDPSKGSCCIPTTLPPSPRTPAINMNFGQNF